MVAGAVAAAAGGGSSVGGSNCGGVANDLSREPGYDATYLHRVSDGHGCPVRLDVIAWLDGACMADAEIDVTAAGSTLLGLPARDRDYVRGPVSDPWLPPTAVPYSPAVPLPRTAVDTGYHRGRAHVWITPHDDSAIYVAGDTAHIAERWPLRHLTGGCA
ncbi:MAG: hypothetical protein V7637_4835 [Mycobacteriales bacterium]